MLSKLFVKRLLSYAGIRIVRKNDVCPTGFSEAVRRLSERGSGLINTVIDIGASDGRWSKAMMEQFPTANYLLIEAQRVHAVALEAFCAKHKNARYTLAAAGAIEGTLFFNASDPFGGLAAYTALEESYIQVPTVTVDTQVKFHELQPPFLIKLDTHGFEVPILDGAMHTLSNASVLVIECYNFRIAPESLLFHEMCELLAGHGFRPIDLYDIMHRPSDSSLWQMDIVFMRAERPEFRSVKFL